jgi:hemerythrin-like domain-containing protein
MSTATPRRTAPGHLLDLPGQTFVAEGPLDLNGMYMAHHAFRRDLTRFAAAARNTPVEAVDVWRALAVRWERFSDILHHHHTTEDDVLWPQLLDVVDAAGDAEGRATLEAMEAEHELIDPLLRSCADGFAAMARTPSTEIRDRLAAATAATVESLRHHLRHEETGALPLVQSLLSAEGWERVEQAAGSGVTPRKLFFLVPWAADGLSPEQLETVLRTMGGPFRVILRLARGSYERRERVAFRFA